MKLREYITEEAVYKEVEGIIRKWVESSYPGLSINFYPHLEIVRIDNKAKFNKQRVWKITEVVNIKIGEIMESYAEKIYISERLERIYKKHPDFDLDVENINDIKHNKLFLQYLEELLIKGEYGK